MFAMIVAAARDIEGPRRRGEREPSFWRGLALMGLVAAAGLVLSVLAGLPTPIE
jgi:hypothetical protein